MNARVARHDLAIMLPETISHYFRDEDAYISTPEVARPSLFARIASVLRWVAELPKRRAVMDELSMLSDHELADIGLSRAELPHVFDPAFVAEREAQRAGVHGCAGRRVA